MKKSSLEKNSKSEASSITNDGLFKYFENLYNNF